MDTVTIAQVYTVVKDALDYSGKRWTDQEVKEFVDRFLAKGTERPTCRFTTVDGKRICCWE